MSAQPMRAGDGMKHLPSGEQWMFAYQDGDRIAWLGWPNGTAPASDFELAEPCTDECHKEILAMMARSSKPAFKAAALAAIRAETQR